MKGKLGLAAALLAAGVLALGAALLVRDRAPQRPAVTAPDVVLITLDTTRSDFVGAFGDASAHTPTLDRLARRGTSFLHAWSPAPLTLTAHCSLMTGLEPPEHGVRDNGVTALPAEIPTLASTLRAAGYDTAGFVSSRVLDRRFGLSRGFERYDDSMVSENRGEYGYPERNAADVTDAATAWLKLAKRPFFLWVHYYDAHAPYTPPEPWKRETPREAYAGEISTVDGQVDRLLAALPGESGRTVIAVVGDHGEGLGEHGERAHGLFLYRASLEVPLVIAGASAPLGKALGDLVSIRAVPATLLRLAGLEASATPFGSALPGLGGPDPKPVYSETQMPANAYGWSPLRSITEPRWRLIDAPRVELYDLLTDAQELKDVSREQPEIVSRLRIELDAIGLPANEKPRQAPTVEVDPQVQASLRSLGYVGSASGPTSRGDAVPMDPKDGLALLRDLEEAKQLLEAGQTQSALSRLRELVKRSPDNVPFLTNLASAQMATGDAESAIRSYRHALELNPRLDFLELNLAEALLQSGQLDEARQHCRKALALNPRLSGAWLGLAEVESKSGHPDAARATLLEAIDAGTESSGIQLLLGQIELRGGRLDEADRALEAATRMAPKWELGWILWSQVAERQGRRKEALERALEAVRANPEHPIANLRAGRLLAAAGRAEEGRPMLSRAVLLAPGTATGDEAQRLLDEIRQDTSKPR